MENTPSKIRDINPLVQYSTGPLSHGILSQNPDNTQPIARSWEGLYGVFWWVQTVIYALSHALPRDSGRRYKGVPLCFFQHVFERKFLDIPRKQRSAHGPFTRYVKLRVAHAPEMSGMFFPATAFKGNRGLAIPACITARAWPHVPWCMPGSLTCGGGKNVPGIPGACATRNFTYLVRGPCYHYFTDTSVTVCLIFFLPKQRHRYWSVPNIDKFIFSLWKI